MPSEGPRVLPNRASLDFSTIRRRSRGPCYGAP
jgi:hypothetical protein